MFSRKKKDGKGAAKSLDVALIGCGPGGMMFLHALNKKRKEGGDVVLPNVTCFERAATPGGVWRDVPGDDKGRVKPEDKPLMYDDLWSNTPKELMEYYDYTFDEHFKKATPSFLPRKDMLEYIIARNSVDGALDGVKFNHTVLSVKHSGSKFTVSVRDELSGTTSTGEYDKVIWAGGLNGTPDQPDDILDVLKEYTGKVMHSMEATEDFEKDCKGKKLLLVGDSSSAEDLALRAVKLGAKHVYICARTGEGDASEMGAWPSDKVTVIFGPPYKVVKGNGFKCQAVYWSEKRERYRRDDDEEPVKVKDIDTVVLCTGYCANLDCLDESLEFDDEGEWSLSKGWTMENNALTISVGNPAPSKHLDVGSTCYPDVYRGLLISNPDMMFIAETQDTPSPLFDLDVAAHLALAYLTGDATIPSEKEMIKSNQKQLEAEMQIPWLRQAMDMAYADEINELPDGHWSENAEDERSIILDRQLGTFFGKRIARDMKTAKYPVDFGDWKKLNKLGEQYVDNIIASGHSRTDLKKDSKDSSWRTFRDVAAGKFTSLHTGTVSASLSAHWLDLKAPSGESTKLATVGEV